MPINWASGEYIEAGVYQFLIAEAEVVESKKGNQGVKMEWQVVGGDYDGKQQTMSIYWKSEWAELACACGLTVDAEAADILNKKFMAEMYKGDPNPETGKSYWRARNYQPVTSKAAPSKPTSAPKAEPVVVTESKPKARTWGKKKTEAEPKPVADEMTSEQFDLLLADEAKDAGETIPETYKFFAGAAGHQHGADFPDHPDKLTAAQRHMILEEVYKLRKSEKTLTQQVINWYEKFCPCPF